MAIPIDYPHKTAAIRANTAHKSILTDAWDHSGAGIALFQFITMLKGKVYVIM